MNFHLSFPIQPFKEKINYTHKLMFIGSCFAENIGESMEVNKFNTLINPNGILYNPLSITSSINRIIENSQVKEDDLFFANDCWNSWEFHSKYSNTNKNECLNDINTSIYKAHNFLKHSNWLFITLGSAHVYKQNASGNVVSNCHKIPQKEFTKQLLSIGEITDNLFLTLKKLYNFNKELKIVFTISPVRYVRDGVIENNNSKARLIESVHQIISKSNGTYYFPAYELVIDDLRDYRFYKSDLVHPNEQAIEYVFEKLKDSAFDEETKFMLLKIKNIITAFKHRPFNNNSHANKKFKETYFKQCSQLLKENPFLNLEDEMKFFGS